MTVRVQRSKTTCSNASETRSGRRDHPARGVSRFLALDFGRHASWGVCGTDSDRGGRALAWRPQPATRPFPAGTGRSPFVAFDAEHRSGTRGRSLRRRAGRHHPAKSDRGLSQASPGHPPGLQAAIGSPSSSRSRGRAGGRRTATRSRSGRSSSRMRTDRIAASSAPSAAASQVVAWAPDGARSSCPTDPPGARSTCSTLRADGTAERQLTKFRGYRQQGRVVARRHADRVHGVPRARAVRREATSCSAVDGGELREIDVRGAREHRLGHRTARAFSSTARTGSSRCDRTGRNALLLREDEFYEDNDPRYSPDGTRIVLASERVRPSGLAVMNTDGSCLTPVPSLRALSSPTGNLRSRLAAGAASLRRPCCCGADRARGPCRQELRSRFASRCRNLGNLPSRPPTCRLELLEQPRSRPHAARAPGRGVRAGPGSLRRSPRSPR